MRKFFRILGLVMIISLICAACGSKNSINSTESNVVEIKIEKVNFEGKKYYDVYNEFEEMGFTSIRTVAENDLTSADDSTDDQVFKITINGEENFTEGEAVNSDAEIIIYYHNLKMVFVPFSSDEYPEGLYEDIKKEFEEEGFENIKLEPIEDLIFGWLTKDGEVEGVLVNGSETFESLESVPFDTEIIIKYHTFPIDNNDDASYITETEDKNIVEDNENKTSENITIENNAEFAELLKLKDEFDTSISQFANKYYGKTIEFDGSIDSVMPYEDYNTRYDVLVTAGNYSTDSVSGPYFKFENTYSAPFGLDFTDSLYSLEGKNVHVIAEVRKFDSSNGLFYLYPVSVEVK